MGSIGTSITVTDKPLFQLVCECKRPGGWYEQHNKGNAPVIIILGSFNSYEFNIVEPNITYNGSVSDIKQGRTVNIEFVDKNKLTKFTTSMIDEFGKFNGTIEIGDLVAGIIESNAIVLSDSGNMLLRSDSKTLIDEVIDEVDEIVPPTITPMLTIDSIVFDRPIYEGWTGEWTITFSGTATNLNGSIVTVNSDDINSDTWTTTSLVPVVGNETTAWTAVLSDWDGEGNIPWNVKITGEASAIPVGEVNAIYADLQVSTPIAGEIDIRGHNWVFDGPLENHKLTIHGYVSQFKAGDELTIVIQDGHTLIRKSMVLTEAHGGNWLFDVSMINAANEYIVWDPTRDVMITLYGNDQHGNYMEAYLESIPPRDRQVVISKVVGYTGNSEIPNEVEVFGKATDSAGYRCRFILARTTSQPVPRDGYLIANGILDENGVFNVNAPAWFEDSDYGRDAYIWFVVYENHDEADNTIRVENYTKYAWPIKRPMINGIGNPEITFRSPGNNQTTFDVEVEPGNDGMLIEFTLHGHIDNSGQTIIASRTVEIVNSKAQAIIDGVPLVGTPAYLVARLLDEDSNEYSTRTGIIYTVLS